MNPQRIATQRLSLLPSRTAGPRSGVFPRSLAAKDAGDLFWRCGVECFKPVYARIDGRFKAVDRIKDEAVREKHASLMDEAKRILQEHRNLIVEAVIPMFTVRLRKKDEPTSDADEHAHDFFCRNLFAVMINTLIASLPTFCLPEDVETTAQTIRNLSEVQSERLSAQLLNFSFGFRPVLTQEQAEKKRH